MFLKHLTKIESYVNLTGAKRVHDRSFMTEQETDRFLVTFNDTATFIFELNGLTPEQARSILGHRREGDTLHIVQERLIQRYLEAVDFQVEVLVFPFSVMFWRNVRLKRDVPRGHRAEPLDQWELELWKRGYPDDFHLWQEHPGRTLCFLRKNQPETERLLRGYLSLMQFGFQISGPGMQGHVIIDIEDIQASVIFTKNELARLKTESHLTIKQVSNHFWPRVTQNLKATIHNYLAGIPYRDRPRIPVFCPEIRVEKGQNTGCQLSVSDIVLIGLLTGLFSRGVKSYDFVGPTKFLLMTSDEIREEYNVFLSETTPDQLFHIEKGQRAD